MIRWNWVQLRPVSVAGFDGVPLPPLVLETPTPLCEVGAVLGVPGPSSARISRKQRCDWSEKGLAVVGELGHGGRLGMGSDRRSAHAQVHSGGSEQIRKQQDHLQRRRPGDRGASHGPRPPSSSLRQLAFQASAKQQPPWCEGLRRLPCPSCLQLHQVRSKSRIVGTVGQDFEKYQRA